MPRYIITEEASYAVEAEDEDGALEAYLGWGGEDGVVDFLEVSGRSAYLDEEDDA